MIKVVVKIDESTERIYSLEVKGHAKSAPYGEDLVCAAVSAVITGGFNALTDGKYESYLKEGHALAKAKQLPSEHDAIVFKTILKQLTAIEESNSKFIKIEILKERMN